MFGFGSTFQTAFAWIEHWPRQRARARAGADDKAATRQRFVEGIHDLRVADNITGPRGQRDRLRVWLHQGIHQPKIG
ncbi:hypothetical protein D1872_333750 [compost metagenome]